jgi:hypothetical protein
MVALLPKVVELPVPVPRPGGLLDVAVAPPEQGDAHWEQGVTYQGDCPTGATTYDECIAQLAGGGAPPAQPAKADNVDRPLRGATPFTVYARYDCSPVGDPDLERRAAAALGRVESWWAERAFWTGLAGAQTTVFPHLAANAQVLDQGRLLQSPASAVSGGPYDPAEALGLLEQALADCYRAQGVIHAPLVALASLQANNLVERRGASLVTAAGNLVAVGAGYPGTSPAGVAPAAGSSWLYATGQVFAYRSPVRDLGQVPGSLDRAENTVAALAERTFVLGWDCCHHAVPVSLGVPI